MAAVGLVGDLAPVQGQGDGASETFVVEGGDAAVHAEEDAAVEGSEVGHAPVVDHLTEPTGRGDRPVEIAGEEGVHGSRLGLVALDHDGLRAVPTAARQPGNHRTV